MAGGGLGVGRAKRGAAVLSAADVLLDVVDIEKSGAGLDVVDFGNSKRGFGASSDTAFFVSVVEDDVDDIENNGARVADSAGVCVDSNETGKSWTAEETKLHADMAADNGFRTS